MRQSLTSQMIDGVVESKRIKLEFPERYGAAKICIECFRMNYNATRVCPNCGHEFYLKRMVSK